jgi:glycosyltransferase involved in cell wall biosynthesis
MSCGIPVVSNKVGLAPIIIKSGIDGILIDDINDINSYVESIKNLKNNRNLYNKISKKSKIKIKSWDWNFKSSEFESMINCFLKDKDDENI